MNTMSGMSPDIYFTKENLDLYLKELGKQYRKIVGKKVPAELTIVGGAAILINYGFRNMTTDIDAIIQAGSAMSEAANLVSDIYGLPRNWLNSDFTDTSSYTDKLAYYSKPYKTFSNVLHIRVISGEYLIAMKLMAGRLYKNDLSDILGILISQKETDQEFSLSHIKNAVEELYEKWENLPERSRKFIESVYNDGQFDLLYQFYRDKESNIAKKLDIFEQTYPDKLTADNVNDIIESLQQKQA